VQDDLDEFERDPWNAVAVVGLRIYHKVSDGDAEDDIVTLKVVRPSPYADTEEEKTKEEDERDRAKAKTKGLDVDDSAKDATLEGSELERKMSIDPSQVLQKAESETVEKGEQLEKDGGDANANGVEDAPSSPAT
jgi:hypothetical protein